MKRKLIIVGDQRFMMKEIFNLSDSEVDQVKIFLEDDHKNIGDIMKKLIASGLNERQKILAGYIMGNTFGVKQSREMNVMSKADRDIPTVAM